MAAGSLPSAITTSTPDSSSAIASSTVVAVSGEQHPSLPYPRSLPPNTPNVKLNMAAPLSRRRKLIRKRIRRPLRRGWNGKAKLGEDRCDAVERCACVGSSSTAVPFENPCVFFKVPKPEPYGALHSLPSPQMGNAFFPVGRALLQTS